MKDPLRKRYEIKVYGIVQGVGFRPFISRIADRHGIYGSVCNKGSCVLIDAQGTPGELAAFTEAIEKEAPPRSVILKVKKSELEPAEEKPFDLGEVMGSERFAIVESEKEEGAVFVSPDIATCPECANELFDPSNRRYLHPFINCTDCGPRLTILDSMPYDRVRTSMGEFPMCDECAHEYTHPGDRRYDAQPVCCNDCGPRVYIIGDGPGEEKKDADGEPIRDGKAIIFARKIIRDGGIVAIKGIGGYHLCCDAANGDAVRRLRDLKDRPFKPFAVMMKDMDVVRRECEVGEEEEKVLTGPQKPIVLLRKKDGGNADPLVAPGNPNIGVMLPYAPVQMLIFGYPGDGEISDTLIMTSGNPSGAPICMNDEEAFKYLTPMCDAILSNNRKIRIRADDSVMSFYEGKPYMVRRSRGYAPLPVIMPKGSGHSVLGIGGELKNTFCVANDDMYYTSPYIGDMADVRSVDALEAAVERMERLFETQPEMICADLHPKYNTTAVAEDMSERTGLPLIKVQHHYAHIASCMAENGRYDEVIGVSFDGTGYGTDGTIWGGEFIRAGLDSFERLGAIKTFVHAGGDKASREGWRIAVSMMSDLYRPEEAAERIKALGVADEQEISGQMFMLGNRINIVDSTSVGRLFDAVSAVLGIKRMSTFEGEAAMALQFAAEKAAEEDPGAREIFMKSPALNGVGITKNEDPGIFTAETGMLFKALSEKRLSGEDPQKLALLFHAELAKLVIAGCEEIRIDTGLDTVALSGGVFQNLLFLDLCRKGLMEKGFNVLIHSLVPPNDGGIALGQAAIATEYLLKESKEVTKCV